MPLIPEAIRGSGGIGLSYVSTKKKKVSTLRGPAQLADLQGALCVPTNNLTCGVDGLDLLLWQRFSILSDLFFVAILILLPIEPTTPVPSDN